jgi:hypothetical protein
MRKLGWKVIRTKYCQYVSLKNRIELYIYAQICLLTYERFLNYIFVDECTVQLCQHGSIYRYKDRIDKIKLIGKYKHEASVHVIGGISRKGRTELIIFTGTMDSNGFADCCSQFLIPFIQRYYPVYHQVYLDNAGYHTKE